MIENSIPNKCFRLTIYNWHKESANIPLLLFLGASLTSLPFGSLSSHFGWHASQGWFPLALIYSLALTKNFSIL